MDRYVGLDAHAETCTLAVLGPSGRRLTSRVVETNGRALLEAIRGIPGRVHLCLEEGTQSAWLHEILEPEVTEIVVVAPPETRGAKDDLRDAWSRAEELRVGAVRTRVYKAPKHWAGLRSAATTYRMATQEVVRVKNRLKAVLRGRGILADAGVYEGKSRGKWLKELPAAGHRPAAEWLGRELDELAPLREEAEGWLLKEAKAHPIIKMLSTAPGMGPLRTAQLVAIVVTPHRFRTRRQFWSYCGLAIVTRSSSDWVQGPKGNWMRAEVRQTRGLNRKRQPVLKAIFKGAATTVVTQLREHPLHMDYQRMLQSGIKPNLAKLTLARRIAAIVLSMWKGKEVYDPGRHKPMTAKR
jgi:transposase